MMIFIAYNKLNFNWYLKVRARPETSKFNQQGMLSSKIDLNQYRMFRMRKVIFSVPKAVT